MLEGEDAARAAARPTPRKGPIRVVLETTTLKTFFPSGRGTSLAIIELGALVFMAGGAASAALGPVAPWFLILAVLLGGALRAVDLESCALFIPGGLYGTVKEALGRPLARIAASALMVEQGLGGALAASVIGRLVAVLASVVLGTAGQRAIGGDNLSTLIAIGILGVVWWRQREGRTLSTRLLTRAAGGGVAVAALVVIWASVTALTRGPAGGAWSQVAWPTSLPSDFARSFTVWTGFVSTPARLLAALGVCLFAMGSTEALAHIAPEVSQPRIRRLGRAARLVGFYSLVGVGLSAVLVLAIVPEPLRAVWADVPLAVLAMSVRGPDWARFLLLAAVVALAGALLALAVQRALVGGQQVLGRLSDDGVLASAMHAPHAKLGTPSRLIDLSAAVQCAAIVASAGRVEWLARSFGVGVVCCALLKTVALIRLRRRRTEPRPFRVPLTPSAGGRQWPLGLVLIAVSMALPAVAALATGDPASLVGAGLVVAASAVLLASERAVARSGDGASSAREEFELLTAPLIGLEQVAARPGNLLVAVRRPHFLAHLAAALETAGDRDVVVMTARIVGVDVSDDLSASERATADERRLLAAVVALAERRGKAVRLLIVPATNVFEAVVETVARLRSAEVYVGESETLAADEQARLLGEAWERVALSDPLDVRLIVHHSSGRTAVYHLGAHPPALNADDLHLVHSLWLDVVKAVGTHVHHHDVVRAALKHMEQELNGGGPARDRALDLVRQVARPADELAAVLKQRDFARLRDSVRNRPASDLAALLGDLAVEDQAVVFRLLPRKEASATFEYLSLEAQERLLRALAQEDVAALLNNMAPDDRTMFLEELPASATQQMLTLLSPEERAVAVTLLGYPEDSIGRLMTPDYIAVREHWTIQEVLDYVRAHGHDSETLNVIYVVNDHGVLIDDLRIREILLAAPASLVADLMDRRFVALKAGDEQASAVAVFRDGDRSALPVTDSTGVLIGIVTIDDVLDVAETAATKEIQRIGGSEALDEPYMTIAFGRMLQKRAGWLTALFLGEMLTATAMSAFEHEIERAVVLALFVPLIISSGGNSGSQASTLVIRAIALGEVELKDWWRVMRREVAAGLALGAILGTVGFARIALWSAFSTLYGAHWLLVALTVGTALVGVVLWGTLVGSLLPFLLRRLGFDPATSSAPFVATLVDVTGLLIYFTVGLVMLRGTLL